MCPNCGYGSGQSAPGSRKDLTKEQKQFVASVLTSFKSYDLSLTDGFALLANFYHGLRDIPTTELLSLINSTPIA
jgi:hypothetical protein